MPLKYFVIVICLIVLTTVFGSLLVILPQRSAADYVGTKLIKSEETQSITNESEAINSDLIVSDSDEGRNILPLAQTPTLTIPQRTSVTTTITTTTLPLLIRPNLSRLKRIGGDPTPLAGEVRVRVPILMYHHIRPLRPSDTPRTRLFIVTPEVFQAQLAALSSAGFHTITPDDLSTALIAGADTLPTMPVLLTFDDGFREHFTVVLPQLKKFGLKATYFVMSQAYRFPAYMTNEMLQEADLSGYVTLASHTRHHVLLTRVSAAARDEEITVAKTELESLVGHPIKYFAYPYGGFNPGIGKDVARAGYDLGFGVRLGSLQTSSTRYELRRIRVLQNENIADLAEAFLK